ncbi:MAG: glycine zipper family protein [Litorimonas sp.]
MTRKNTSRTRGTAAIFALIGFGVSGCASTGADYTPVIDGPEAPTFQADLQDCQELATTKKFDNGDTRTDAAVGAGVGAVIGVIDGGVAEAAAGAVIGGLFGAGGGALETRDERKDIVMACMTGRGHKVVG